MITKHTNKRISLITNSINLIIIKRHLTSLNSNHSASKTTLTVVTNIHHIFKRNVGGKGPDKLPKIFKKTGSELPPATGTSVSNKSSNSTPNQSNYPGDSSKSNHPNRHYPKVSDQEIEFKGAQRLPTPIKDLPAVKAKMSHQTMEDIGDLVKPESDLNTVPKNSRRFLNMFDNHPAFQLKTKEEEKSQSVESSKENTTANTSITTSTNTTDSSNTTVQNDTPGLASALRANLKSQELFKKEIPDSSISVYKSKALTEIQLHQYNAKSTPPFKSLSNGESYIPIIHRDNNSNTFTDQQIIDFCLERGLLKNDDKHDASVNILIKPEGFYVIGDKTNKVKLTQIGSAYHKKITINRFINSPQEYPPEDLDFSQADIIMVKRNVIKGIIDSGNVTHLLHAYPHGNYFYTSGSYTHKKLALEISKTQYSDYQTHKESSGSDDNVKPSGEPQRFLVKKQFEKIHKDQVYVTKWSKDYIAFVNEKALFKKIFDKQKTQPCSALDNTGVTKEEALTMCLDTDYNLAKAQKHPKTLDQESYLEKQKATKNIKPNDDDTNKNNNHENT